MPSPFRSSKLTDSHCQTAVPTGGVDCWASQPTAQGLQEAGAAGREEPNQLAALEPEILDFH